MDSLLALRQESEAVSAARCYQHSLSAIMVLAMIFVSGCVKHQGDTAHPSDKAFVDSRTPPGLSPQYFPPAGFVWSGFKSDNLPEARYGVASPPVNPRANILIIADAQFPAEAYFGLIHDLILFNYTVWIYEAPGQGGSGRYFLQGERIHTPDFRNNVKSTQHFIRMVIRPKSDQPLYIVGTGTGALTALHIDTKMIKASGVVVYSPYISAPKSTPAAWRGEDIPSDEWGQIGHKWQKANPDLRLRAVSKVWQTEMDKAEKKLAPSSFKNPSFGSQAPPRLVITNSGPFSSDKAVNLCAGIKACHEEKIYKNSELGAKINKFIEQDAQYPEPS